MTARITTDIFCDQCGDWEHGVTSHKPRIRQARRNVGQDGWTVIRGQDGDLQDLCPRCNSTRRGETKDADRL